MFAAKIAALAALASVTACSAPPGPGTPAPSGINSTRGGGTQVVDPQAGQAGRIATTPAR